MSPYQHIKRCATEATHPKKHKPLLLRNKPLTNRRLFHIRKDGTCTFYQIQIFADAKRQSIPIQKNTPKCHIRFVSHFYYIIDFDICKYFQRVYIRLSYENNNIIFLKSTAFAFKIAKYGIPLIEIYRILKNVL